MTISARIPCINPRCRRTASREKFGSDTEIICGKCWRALPAEIRERRRHLEKRLRFIRRALAKRHPDSPTHYGTRQTEITLNVQWDAIKARFTETTAPPVGLENFLKEVGL